MLSNHPIFQLPEIKAAHATLKAAQENTARAMHLEGLAFDSFTELIVQHTSRQGKE